MTETLVTPRVLREYALVADGERGALIAPDGSVAWLCVPRWDSPAAFSALLGGPGRYTVALARAGRCWSGRPARPAPGLARRPTGARPAGTAVLPYPSQ